MQEVTQMPKQVSAQVQQAGSGRSVSVFLKQYWHILLAPALVLILWQGLVWISGYPAFILPSPGDVASSFARALTDGTLLRHTLTTLSEIFAGLALGLSLALFVGYFLAKSRLLEKLLSPYIVASQAVPAVAVAPLLIIWFGAGHLSKVLIAALIVFFPMLISTVVGIRSVDEDLRELMRSLKAGRWDTFSKLEVPGAMPVLLGGLKVSVTLAVIGAVVGEFVGAKQGLGFLINQARGLFNTPLVFVAILSLVFITLLLYGAVSLAEAWLLRWRE